MIVLAAPFVEPFCISKRFPEKWFPVIAKNARPNKELDPRFDAIRAGI
jgi:hypothetical protein